MMPAKVTCANALRGALTELLARRRLTLEWVADGEPIPASYWGETEAGVIGTTVYARSDTPVHSVLHTACHVLCMSEERQAKLHTDCGGSDPEEEAVCYLQCLLADQLRGYSREQLFADMDAWGYHFILGSTQAWFEHGAGDARQWLAQRSLLNA
mgnify:CR=1 FL=1